VHWTKGVDEVLASDGNEIEVNHVPVDIKLMAAVEALDFVLIERYSGSSLIHLPKPRHTPIVGK